MQCKCDSEPGADVDGSSSGDESLDILLKAVSSYNELLLFLAESNEVWDDDDVVDEFHSESISDMPSLPVFNGNSPENQRALSLQLWLVGFFYPSKPSTTFQMPV